MDKVCKEIFLECLVEMMGNKQQCFQMKGCNSILSSSYCNMNRDSPYEKLSTIYWLKPKSIAYILPLGKDITHLLSNYSFPLITPDKAQLVRHNFDSYVFEMKYTK